MSPFVLKFIDFVPLRGGFLYITSFIGMINALFSQIFKVNGFTFSLVTFPKNLARIFRSDRCTYVRNIFILSFYIFEVMTHFEVKESLLA